VQNKIHPGDPMDKNLYDRARGGREGSASVRVARRGARSLIAIAFLTKGGVFTDDMIDAYIGSRWKR
jgi:glutamine synthetase